MPRIIFSNKESKREFMHKNLDKTRNWPIRPEFDNTNNKKIFNTFHTEFVNDISPLDNVCCPKNGFKRGRVVLRCSNKNNPPSKCGLDFCFTESSKKDISVYDQKVKETKIQNSRNKKNVKNSFSASKMAKNIYTNNVSYNKNSLKANYDYLEDSFFN